jgi:3-hydroxybutyrate dehydrogenase
MTRALDGKSALITGSARGLGLAAAHALAAAGCHIVLHDIGADETTAALRTALEREHRVRTLYWDADLRQPDEIARMMSQSLAAFGSIDILVNNAVVRHAAPVEDFSVQAWDDALAVNVSAAFHTIRLALPRMKHHGWGRIINVSSIYGVRGAANRIGYVTSKTALLGMTRAVAMETLAHGITCNAVCPGTAETPVHDSTIQASMAAARLSRAEAEQRFMAGKQPTGRLIPAKSVAALIVFLCGPDAADITGAALPVDGGWSSA